MTHVYNEKEEIQRQFDAASASSVDPNLIRYNRKVDQDDAGSDTSSSFSSLESEGNLKARENWTGRLDFLLSCIGFAVGLGNIWRFPYLCYKSGGGAFLLPYTIFLVLCGLPLFFMEVSLGQFASLSPISLWRISPFFKGLGYGMVIISGLVCIYYNVIITWTFYFLFQSMRSELPWSTCGNEWNTENCVVQRTSNNTASQDNGTIANNTRVSNATVRSNVTVVPASEEFWNYNVLEITDGINEIGGIRWPLFGCLALAWTCVFLCLCKGVKSSGKVVKVTATFPYVVLTILLIRGLTLPGSLDGIKYYLIPDFDKILTFDPWADAAIQIFYSVGMAWGSLITMASYNKFNNNVYHDAMIVPILNCSTSVFAGLVIFSVLGFMSKSTGLPIDQVAVGGPGLIFIVYPEAVAQMPLNQLWAILFFLMVFTIGLDSQFGMFETMTSAFIDEFPHLLRRRKLVFTAFMCLIEFVLGIPIVFRNGIYILTVIDWYSSTFSLMLLSFTECMVISWIYGVDRFVRDIELMIGYKPIGYWKFMWKFCTPLIILGIWLANMVKMTPVKLGDYEYPNWAIIFGWSLAVCSILPVPILALIGIFGEKGTLFQRIRKLVHPAVNWGPALTEDRERYIASLNSYERERYEAAQSGLDLKTFRRRKANRSSNCIYKEPVSTINMEAGLNSDVNSRMLVMNGGASNLPPAEYSMEPPPSYMTLLGDGEKNNTSDL